MNLAFHPSVNLLAPETLNEPFVFKSGLQAQVFSDAEDSKAWSLQSKTPSVVTAKQCHSSTIVNWPFLEEAPNADGIATFFKHNEFLALGVYTADCLPICLSWRAPLDEACPGMVVHAGWKGFAKGILRESLGYFQQAPTEVFIGPAIFGSSYECGLEVAAALEREGCSQIQKTSNKCFPDLQWLATAFFIESGVQPKDISVMRVNTYSQSELPSYRRSCHLGHTQNRRMLTVLSNRKSSC